MQRHLVRWQEWVARCRGLLSGNQITSGQDRYTRPAPHVYEHQWLWDSCFHAMTYRWFDPLMAQDELLSVVAKQVRDGADAGMLPHMTYWQGDGVELWGEAYRSTITQPPLVAIAALRVYETTYDKDFLTALYPHLTAHHVWLARRRVLDDTGLAAIIHPWESGWDASPRWDAPMELHDPTDDESKAARHALVAKLRSVDCDARKLVASGSFCVYPIDFNAICAADLEATGSIANWLGKHDEAQHWQQQARQIQRAVGQTLLAKHGGFDLNAHALSPLGVTSAARFIALFGGCATAAQAQVLVTELEQPRYAPSFPVPTTPTDSDAFAGGHYWRGNVWLAVNWLIYTGLRRYGYVSQARKIAERSLNLVEQSGFHEYFDPLTGQGLGPAQQSWSAIVLDMLGTEREVSSL